MDEKFVPIREHEEFAKDRMQKTDAKTSALTN